MRIFKKPYIFIIIFIGLIFGNILITKAWCTEGPYYSVGDCNCKGSCDYNIQEGIYYGVTCYDNSGHRDLTCPLTEKGFYRGALSREWWCSDDNGCYEGGCTPYCKSACVCGCSENTCDGGICNSAVSCSSTSCSDSYRFTRETRTWQACGNCSGSEVPDSSNTTYQKDCSCQDNLDLACYPDVDDGYLTSNYDRECRPEITNSQLFDSTGIDELTIQETTEGEEFYMSLYQRFRIPGSQALLKYFATGAKTCSINCEYLSLDYIQEGIEPEYLPYPCNKDAGGNISFEQNEKYPYDARYGGSFYISPQYRGLVKYHVNCYGPEGGPECGHDEPYPALEEKTINLVLYDFTYREISPNEIINYLKNQLASVSQIIKNLAN